MRSLITALVLLTPAAALAGGYNVPNVNPRDLALSGSTVSSTEGAEAAYVNPSELGDHPGLNVTLGGTMIDYKPTWIDPTHTVPDVVGHTDLALLGDAAISYGLNLGGHGLGFGISVNIPGGGHINWPASWPGNTQIISVNRRTYQFSGSVGFQIIPQLKIGASVLYIRTTEDLIQALPFGTSTGQAEVATSGGRASFGASLEFVPIKNLSIAAQYQHLAEQNLEGDVHFQNVPKAFQSVLFDQPISHELTFPNILNVGASYKIGKWVRILGAYQFTRYIVYGADDFIGEFGANLTVARNYHNENTWRLATEIFVLPWLRVFVGGQRDISPQPADTLSPSLPDSSSWSVGGGFGLDLWKPLSLLAAYQYTGFDQVTAVGPNAFPGTYQVYAHIWTIGAQFHWL